MTTWATKEKHLPGKGMINELLDGTQEEGAQTAAKRSERRKKCLLTAENSSRVLTLLRNCRGSKGYVQKEQMSILDPIERRMIYQSGLMVKSAQYWLTLWHFPICLAGKGMVALHAPCMYVCLWVLTPGDCLDKSLQYSWQVFRSSLPLPSSKGWEGLAHGHTNGFLSKAGIDPQSNFKF